MQAFWAVNVPKIGFSHHYILRLLFTLSGYHLAFECDAENDQRRKRTLLVNAATNLDLGLVGYRNALAKCNQSSATGPGFVAAMLLCYCTLAAGPTDDGDMLVCNVNGRESGHWLSVVQSFRIAHSAVDPKLIFTGLMAPMRPSTHAQTPDTRPQCQRLGVDRVCWEDALGEAYDFVCGLQCHNRDFYMREFEFIRLLYEATYGKADEPYLGPEHARFVFSWLYRMKTLFNDLVYEKDPPALVLLAYYVPLFFSMPEAWYVRSWPGHIINKVNETIGHGHKHLLRWPMKQLMNGRS